MSELIVMGGCSKAGKSTLIEEYSKRHSLKKGRMFDYILRASRDENRPDIKKDYIHLEMPAVRRLTDECHKERALILDVHYAIQPIRDTARALQESQQPYAFETYELSMSEEAIKRIAKELEIHALCLTASPEIVVERRKQSHKLNNVEPRSLDIRDIEEEIKYECLFFEEFCKIANQIRPIKLNMVDNSKDLESTIKYMESLRIGIK